MRELRTITLASVAFLLLAMGFKCYLILRSISAPLRRVKDLAPPGKLLSLEARIYPEKQIYLLGEPIFLGLETVNHGGQRVVIDSRFGEPCFKTDTIEVVGVNAGPAQWPRSVLGE